MSTRLAPPSGVSLTLHRLLSRNSLIVAAALAVAAGLAWIWLYAAAMPNGMDMAGMDMSGMDMSGMDMAGMVMPVEPWSTAYLLTAFGMWATMMVAMMIPSAAPMILLHARIDKAGSEQARLVNTFLFIAAYLLVWTVFSMAAVTAQALLVGSGVVSAMALSIGNRYLGAALLVVAAVYELTAVKRLCLAHCQAPLLFIHRFWRPGAAGAFRLGIRHGLYCVGCCWALMLLLFVGGVMNLAWIAGLGILALAEKIAPPAWRADRWVAALLLAGAAALLWR